MLIHESTDLLGTDPISTEHAKARCGGCGFNRFNPAALTGAAIHGGCSIGHSPFPFPQKRDQNMTNEEARRDYERARRILHAALDRIRADEISPPMSFAALVDLLVDWSLQMGGKETLWDAVALMHSRVDEHSQIAQQMPRHCVN